MYIPVLTFLGYTGKGKWEGGRGRGNKKKVRKIQMITC